MVHAVYGDAMKQYTLEHPRASNPAMTPLQLESLFFGPSMPPSLYISSARSSDLDLAHDAFEIDPRSPLSARALYAQSFSARRESSPRLPPRPIRKNTQEMMGYGTTEEEFEALPTAVRKKYFSSLERLRLAQNGSSHATHDLPIQSHPRKSSLADRRGVTLALCESRRGPGRKHRKSAKPPPAPRHEASWFLTPPNSDQDGYMFPASRAQDSLILDAADEAYYRATRRKRSSPPPFDRSQPDTPRDSAESLRPDIQEDPTASMAAHIYESFRWMDEEQDLDLKLALDDYHANLDGAVIPTPTSARRPSFRRQMSVTKKPFGRNSISSLNPVSPPPEPPFGYNHPRSRTMSVIQPKTHLPKTSLTTIDPNAAHYQDPEARLKLRVYLASPQKFDEAIEFGFPSMDGLTEGADQENKPPGRTLKDVLRTKKSFTLERGQSFLHDDAVSLSEDDVSLTDPESPSTPPVFGPPSKNRTSPVLGKASPDFSHLGLNKPTLVRQPELYIHSHTGSREMTLRMTLTRPDLRADETTIYGWQCCKSPLSEAASSSLDEKAEIRGPFGGLDGWGPEEKETGAVKRFWKKVKCSQRKTT